MEDLEHIDEMLCLKTHTNSNGKMLNPPQENMSQAVKKTKYMKIESILLRYLEETHKRKLYR